MLPPRYADALMPALFSAFRCFHFATRHCRHRRVTLLITLLAIFAASLPPLSSFTPFSFLSFSCHYASRADESIHNMPPRRLLLMFDYAADATSTCCRRRLHAAISLCRCFTPRDDRALADDAPLRHAALMLIYGAPPYRDIIYALYYDARRMPLR